MTGKVGIDNYSLFPLNMEPLLLLRWAADHGAAGVAFSGLEPHHQLLCNDSYLREIKQLAADLGLYLEWGGGQHVPRDLTTWERKEIVEINRRAAREAFLLGTGIVRSCSGGLMRWNRKSLPTNLLLAEMIDSLKTQRQMFRDYGVILAIETHFEFTTHELVRVFEASNAEPGDWLGICLDTMNLLTLLEDPVWATERILPWVVSTHMKDGGLLVTREGFRSFPCAIGTGIVDFPGIMNLLSKLPLTVALSIEDHAGWFDIPLHDPVFRKEFPDLHDQELNRLVGLAQLTRSKMDAGTCTMTDRSEWPEVCAGRVYGDLNALKAIVNDLSVKG